MAALLQNLLDNPNDRLAIDRAASGDRVARQSPAASRDVWADWRDSRDLMAVTLASGTSASGTSASGTSASGTSASGALASNPRLVRSLGEMAACRPDVIVVKGFGVPAMLALLYSRWQRRTRVVLWPTSRVFPAGWGRLLLGLSDAVVASTPAMAGAVENHGVPASRIFTLADACDVSAFLDIPVSRPPAIAHRMICDGPLTPAAGVADFQSAVASWAEANPERAVEVWWAGEGSLRGVLEAQPLPGNVSQRFLGVLEAPARVAAFAECGLLVLPSLHGDWGHAVPEAQAAGLPVLGSRRSHDVVHQVEDGLTGWRFDPFSPESVYACLDQALRTPGAELDRMRAAGRAACRQGSQGAGALGVGARMARIAEVVAQPARTDTTPGEQV